jgi:hypothetical protein
MSGETNEKSPRKQRPTFIRRFGGYFLGRLFAPIPTLSPIQRAVDAENTYIDQRQQAHYHANLFRETKENSKRLPHMKELFEQELAERDTIEARFALFADPLYADFVNTLDLGETKQPGSHDEVIALKEEYGKLVTGLIEAGLIDNELSRAEAKPTIHFSIRADSDYVAAERNRDLFKFVDGERTISVAKRMTFLVPHEVYEAHSSPLNPLRARSVKKIEALIDAQDGSSIIPVRTVYYATSKPIDT